MMVTKQSLNLIYLDKYRVQGLGALEHFPGNKSVLQYDSSML